MEILQRDSALEDLSGESRSVWKTMRLGKRIECFRCNGRLAEGSDTAIIAWRIRTFDPDGLYA